MLRLLSRLARLPFLAVLVTGRGHPLQRGSPATHPRPAWVLGYAVLGVAGSALGCLVYAPLRLDAHREAQDILGRHFSCFYTPEDRAVGVPERNLDKAAVYLAGIRPKVREYSQRGSRSSSGPYGPW